MGDLFGSKKKQKVDIYGELPGRQGLGGQLATFLGKWLGDWGSEGSSIRGTGEAQRLWQGAAVDSGLGRARLRDMLSPGWAERTPEGLLDAEAADKAQTEGDIARARRGLLMQFARHGQTLSSPMMRALADAELGARGALQRRSGERRYSAYQQRLGLLPQLLGMATERPYQAASLLRDMSRLGQGERAMLLRSILGYLTASRGVPVVTSEETRGGLSDLF
jgi:hypothetical protein